MTTVVLVGIGGYGGLIAEDTVKNATSYGCCVVGAVDPFFENSPVFGTCKEKNIKLFRDIKDFYAENTADVAIISTPIHLHREQCICAMENGSDVLCEKPIAPTLQDAYAMEECAKRTGKHLNIGFQLSHAPAILKLKEDILNNTFGSVKYMYSAVCWPRNSAYFARPWAAKATVDGKWVLDSIAMNACAHYLHNMFFLLGETTDSSAQPQMLGASLYRANNIETYDTACVEVTVKDGVPLRFVASHATEYNFNPMIKLVFEKACVYMSEDGGNESVYAVFEDGTKEVYGATYDDRFKKIPYALDVFRGKKQPVCTVETALPHLKCVNALSQFFEVKNFDSVKEKDGVKYVPDLARQIKDAFEKGVMPEIYRPEKTVDITDYTAFEGIK